MCICICVFVQNWLEGFFKTLKDLSLLRLKPFVLHFTFTRELLI